MIEALEQLPYAPALRLFARPRRMGRAPGAPPFAGRNVDTLWPWPPRDLDVFHAPDVRVPRWSRAPVVVTLHDLSALDRSDHATPRFLRRKKRGYFRAARVARRLITHTESVRRDLSSRLGLTMDRIDAIPLAPGFDDATDAAREFTAELKPLPVQLLTIGGPSRRKGSATVGSLLRMWRVEFAWRPAVVWVGSGGITDRAAVLAAIDREDRAQVSFCGHVSDARLTELFRQSDGLLSLSTTEGFGLPLLEAAARRLPVLARVTPILREVLGDGAFWFESPSTSAPVFRSFLSHDERQRKVISASARAREFSWRETARRTLASYERALDG